MFESLTTAFSMAEKENLYEKLQVTLITRKIKEKKKIANLKELLHASHSEWTKCCPLSFFPLNYHFGGGEKCWTNLYRSSCGTKLFNKYINCSPYYANSKVYSRKS